jgi:hypothetical protein
MQRVAFRRVLPALFLPLLLTTGGCDVVSAGFGSEETAQWQKTYTLPADGRLEIVNVNGRIDVAPSSGNTVEVTAIKKAKAGSPEAAKAELQRITIAETVTPSAIRIETKMDRSVGGLFSGSGKQVEYHVKVPAAAQVKVSTVNGGIEIDGLNGRIEAEATNGGIRGRNIGGPISASTTNGGVDVDLTRVADGGVKLECTNGGIDVRLPSDSKATISARITNGGIKTDDALSIEKSESSRRRLEGRLNGGGPSIDIDGTNGGISITARSK